MKQSINYNRSLTDELLSYGERISARLFACVLSEHGLPAKYQDARTLIKTNDTFGKAEILLQETTKQIVELVLPSCTNHIVVTEGFIGSTLQNITTTLGRGGSDYSAAILAEAMQAAALQIWTDVSGIYTVDPRLVPHAKPIDNMCFAEAAELAQFGAKVLHPATLWPAIRKNIPVFVGSSLNPQEQGTWIRANDHDQTDVSLIRAITLRRHQSLLTIHSLEMLHTHGFLAKIFSVLALHELSVDLVTTSEVSVALTLNHSESGPDDLLTPIILAELKAIGNVSLTVNKNLCLIALVGNHLHMMSGISGRVFKTLSSFNIRLICHGASPHNLCFLVNEGDAHAVIQAMHSEFFENTSRSFVE
jgi:aspartate kinase